MATTPADDKKEKLKALGLTIDKLDKSYGKGSVMKLGDSKIVAAEVIPTGSLGLDIALGIGGLPKGRIIEIYGPESSGKCLTKDSQILTSSGWKSVEEIFLEAGLPLFTTTKEVVSTYPLINRFGEIENTTHFTYNGKKPVIEITTKTGFKFKRTYKHPLLVLTENGNFIWKWTGELKVGDAVVKQKKTVFGNGNRDKDICYSIGLLIADGGFTNGVNMTNNDPCIKEFIETKMPNVLGFDRVTPRLNSRASESDVEYANAETELAYGHTVAAHQSGVNSPTVLQDNASGEAHNTFLNEDSYYYQFVINKKDQKRSTATIKEFFFDRIDLTECLSKDKYFPKWVRELGQESMKEVISGYMDCESHISERGLEVTSASYMLLYQLKLMLSQFGITSLLRESFVKEYPENTYYDLCIYSTDFELYLEKIGTRSNYRVEQIKEFIKVRESLVQETQTNYKSLPLSKQIIRDIYYSFSVRSNEIRGILTDSLEGCCFLTPTVLGKLLNVVTEENESHWYLRLKEMAQYEYEVIANVEELEPEPTFDFAMKSTASFIADGCINHNTTLAIHAIANCQKNGGIAAFIDAEHAFDRDYAQNLGVNINELLISQPDDGEQALDIAEHLIKSGAIDIIVIDSVAALVPRSELEGEMGESKMGLHARLMSQAMRKLTGTISKTGCCCIFINQLREKIGVMFGNPETTTGGNALKFYASVRLDIRRNAQLKDGDAIVGNRTKVKVVKNKLAPPFRTCEFDIVYGKGVSKVGELVDLGAESGVIQKSGSWFSYEGTKLGQGRDGVKLLLEDNPELAAEIEAKIKAKHAQGVEVVPVEAGGEV